MLEILIKTLLNMNKGNSQPVKKKLIFLSFKDHRPFISNSNTWNYISKLSEAFDSDIHIHFDHLWQPTDITGICQ